MKNKLLILLLFIADAYLKELKIPISPCPDIFHYAYDGTEVYGIFNFEGAELNKSYNLQLHMVYEDTVYIKGKGKLSLIEDQESALLNITRNKPVSYKIKFPIQTEIPEVTEIYMNNILLCFNEDSIEQSNTQIIYHNIFTTFGLTKYKSFTDFADPDFLRSQAKQFVDSYKKESNYTMKPKEISQAEGVPRNQRFPHPANDNFKVCSINQDKDGSLSSESHINEICGIAPIIPDPLIETGSINTVKGSWPWIVAVITDLLCNGNLISAKTVITTAHCINLGQRQCIPRIGLGFHTFNFIDNNPNRVLYLVDRILVHPDYDPKAGNFDGDIALIFTKQIISFTDYIRPICLWTDETHINNLEGEKGIVSGWGLYQGKRLSLLNYTTTILSEEACQKTERRFSRNLSHRNFCAKNDNEGGPCDGHSGSGLAIHRNGRWILKGIVTGVASGINHTLFVNTTSACNNETNIIYSDIAKYYPWIKENILY